jgi:hypothetical protein
MPSARRCELPLTLTLSDPGDETKNFNFFAAHSEPLWPCTLTLAAEEDEYLGTGISRRRNQAADCASRGLGRVRLSI